MKTKFGTARKNKQGYYCITSSKEGNNNKYLHRLVYEDYYKVSILDGVVCHHIDHDKTNNHISNLKLMYHGDHARLHHEGKTGYWQDKTFSEEHKKKMSESMKGKNKNFYATITKDGFNRGKQNYCIYFNGKRIKTSITISKLLDWFTVNYPRTILRIPKRDEI